MGQEEFITAHPTGMGWSWGGQKWQEGQNWAEEEAAHEQTHNFFNEKYLLKCHKTTSKAKKGKLPGTGYFASLYQPRKLTYTGSIITVSPGVFGQWVTLHTCISPGRWQDIYNVTQGVSTVGSFHCSHPVQSVHETNSKGNWHHYPLD